MKAILMQQLRRPSLGAIAVLLTLAICFSIYVAKGGHMFSPGALNAQPRGQASLGGVRSHAEIAGNCAACHAPPLSGETMADRCMQCHANVRQQLDTHGPLHGRMAAGTECRACHTEHQGPHAALTSLKNFNHDWASFQLTGKHQAADCKSCHVDNVFKGTAKTCASCHAEPAVHQGKFGNACAKCHTTNTWTLAGATSLANFNHDLAAFKLTGKHQTIDCRSCHVNNTFKGTAQTCVSCHAEPTIHKGRFGAACAQCHSTSTWDGAVIQHAFFSINHRGSKGACAKCHNDPQHFTTYTCYNCHHTAAREEARGDHVRAKQKRNLVSIENCALCHARKSGRRVAKAGHGDAAIDACCLAGLAGDANSLLDPGVDRPRTTALLKFLRRE